ncbi:FAD-binding oxidoreductase [Vineibacter terrae]|uniref:FAD-binding oxidoreductase n=1 Tax=Vineibacter terrae TaxID=2586908 RepID=UPI002E2ED471|nr:FAD-linked oxidase C-terminal domain-containing protein [Vineibacter terrae]HEX2885158.1 FAD-linked oxidase C-terminal domain-containing protein [Vineibacter terrae]
MALAAAVHPPHIDETIAELKVLFGDRLSTAAAVREQHGKDISYHEAHLPDAVVFAESTAEVQKVVQICARYRTPIIAFGTGTSLEGHISAPQGGISVDVSRMNQVLQVNEADLDVVVQPGVTRKQLNEYIRATGLFFPIDPGADASIGGMTSTRASGTNAVRYGTMRENVLALQVVTPDGRIMRLGRRARKSAAGYDLVKLFVGSEGTLGIITEITLRLYGIPEAMAAATCAFESLEGAVNTVIQTIQSGVPIARIELLDDIQVDSVNRYSKMSLPVKNTLFLEFHGTEASVKEQAEMVQAIASDNGGGSFAFTTQAEERTRMWQARHDAAWANKALKAGWGMWATDVCVPISRLAECILATKNDIVALDLVAPIVGHVGDGNFHLTIMVDPDDPTCLKRADALNDRMVARALELGGTCTGEHGVGLGKIKYLYAEHGESVSLMRAVKRAIDPDNIMNPGKIFGPLN